MLRFITHLKKQRAYHRNFAAALELVDKGKKVEAFIQLKSMLADHPADPYLRNQILFLGKELHQPVDLPKMLPSNQH
jgi:hypothetical protein